MKDAFGTRKQSVNCSNLSLVEFLTMGQLKGKQSQLIFIQVRGTPREILRKNVYENEKMCDQKSEVEVEETFGGARDQDAMQYTDRYSQISNSRSLSVSLLLLTFFFDFAAIDFFPSTSSQFLKLIPLSQNWIQQAFMEQLLVIPAFHH